MDDQSEDDNREVVRTYSEIGGAGDDMSMQNSSSSIKKKSANTSRISPLKTRDSKHFGSLVEEPKETITLQSPLKRMKTTIEDKDSDGSLKSLEDENDNQSSQKLDSNFEKLNSREKIKRKIAISNLNIEDITI